ncbi:hypothetical protein Tco_1412614, partial [Tanacetum coccineum]
FDDKQGTIFNANKEIAFIAPRRNDAYVLNMSSLTPNGVCFFAKASEMITANEQNTPHTEDVEDPLDLVDTEGTQEQNLQDELINGQPTEEPLGNNTKTSDRWSRDQHIKLVNIIGEPSEDMLTRSMATKLTAASASECLIFAGRGNKPDPRDIKISSLKQHIQELEFSQLHQDSPEKEAETESNIQDDGLEDVDPFGGGNPGFYDEYYDNPLLTKETESELIIWDIRDEEEEYPFVNKYPSFQEEPIVLVEEESCPV